MEQLDANLLYEIKKLKNGDTSSYEKFYELTSLRIYNLIFSITKEHSYCNELIPVVYNQIYSNIHYLQDESIFWAWASMYATDCAYNHMLKIGLDTNYIPSTEGINFFESMTDDTEAFIPERFLHNAEYLNQIKAMIDSLPTIDNIILQYYYYEKLSVTEICNKLGLNRSIVCSSLHNMRQGLSSFIYYSGYVEGEKMYSIASVPIFWLAFNGIISSVASLAGGAALTGAAMAGSGMAAGGSGVAMAGSGMAAGGSGVAMAGSGMAAGGSGAAMAGSGMAAGGSGAASGSSAGVIATAGTVAVKAGMGIGAKILIGTAVCATLVGGGIGIHHLLTSGDDKEVTTEAEATPQEATPLEATTEEITTEATTVTTTEEPEDIPYFDEHGINVSGPGEFSIVSTINFDDVPEPGDQTLTGTMSISEEINEDRKTITAVIDVNAHYYDNGYWAYSFTGGFVDKYTGICIFPDVTSYTNTFVFNDNEYELTISAAHVQGDGKGTLTITVDAPADYDGAVFIVAGADGSNEDDPPVFKSLSEVSYGHTPVYMTIY